MGTRHLTIIRKDKKVRLAQYGQWDGYPSGQGINLLEILRTIDIERLRNITDELTPVTQADYDIINERVDKEKINWQEVYPEYSRDTGTDIIKLIMDKGVRKVQIDEEMLKPNIWIEGTFEIDFDKNKYICCGVKFPLDKLPTNELFLKKFKDAE